MPRRYRFIAWIVPLLLLNWLLLAVSSGFLAGHPYFSLASQVLGGTVFGQTAVAAAWATFGPLPFMWRFPLSLVWLAVLAVMNALSGWLNGGSSSDFIIVGALLLCQWLALQLPLWGIAIGFRVQLHHADENECGGDLTPRQFGIRQLMLVTAIIAVLLGLGRIAVPHLFKEVLFLPLVVAVVAFFVAAEVIMTLPLVLATLLRRHTLIAVLSALVFMGAITACELPLLKMVFPSVGSSGVLEIVAVNIGTAIMVLALLTVVRLNGYSLTSTRAAAKA